jgi:hypothetical protein
MLKRFLVPVSALVVLSGCNNPITDPAAIDQCGPALDQDRADELVKSCLGLLRLIDPESARVRGVTIDGPRRWSNIQGTFSGQQVSFMLNSKNHFGGYAGERRFVCLLLPNGRYTAREANAWDK